MSEPTVIRTKIGKRLAYVHPPAHGRMSVFIPDPHRDKEDLHNEVSLTPREAVRLARALIKQARIADNALSHAAGAEARSAEPVQNLPKENM